MDNNKLNKSKVFAGQFDADGPNPAGVRRGPLGRYIPTQDDKLLTSLSTPGNVFTVDMGTASDRDFKRQLDCAVLALFANNPRLDEMFRTGNLEVFVCDYSDAIFAERKKREAGE